jgi:hypothetical protein
MHKFITKNIDSIIYSYIEIDKFTYIVSSLGGKRLFYTESDCFKYMYSYHLCIHPYDYEENVEYVISFDDWKMAILIRHKIYTFRSSSYSIDRFLMKNARNSGYPLTLYTPEEFCTHYYKYLSISMY